MNLLLDTHAFLWFLWNDNQLSSPALQLIRDAQNRKFVSVVSCWEIAIKSSIGKLRLGLPAQKFLSQHIAINNFSLLTVSLEHATATETLPFHHRDPFDRILVAQCQTDSLELASADKMFDQYGINRLW